MGREIDLRDWSVNRLTPARQEELTALAAEASVRLPGDHELRITGFDRATGNPSTVASDLAEPERDNHIQRALNHVRSIGRVLGLAATQPTEFAADPNIQRTSSGAVTVHLQQQYKGIPVFQAAQAVRFAPDDHLVDTAGSTVTVDVEVPVLARLSVQEAALAAAKHVALPGPDEQVREDQFGQRLDPPTVDVSGYSPRIIAAFPDKPEQTTVLDGGPFGEPIKAGLIWFSMGEELRLAWQIIVTMPENSGQFRTLVDAQSGEILFCHQMMHSLTARGNVFLQDGATPRQTRDFPLTLATYDLPIPGDLPSPFPGAWVTADSTEGNNVRAHLGVAGVVLRGEQLGNAVSFAPNDATGDDQKVLNIFFFNNFMHDYMYILGFREADGNFQADNLGRGGLPSDRVDARAHSGQVIGTANMSTRPDGTSPVMNMGLVSSTNRHTAMDASVVFHEYTHGVTNRLVGGRMNTSALEAPQSVGMGEGWSDYVACTILGTTIVGSWVVNDPRGIRGFPFDASFPDNFANLGSGRYGADPGSGFPQDEHNVGEIWCATLLEMNRRLAAELGDPQGRHLSVQLVVDALKLSPALPSFLDVRDAIVVAVDNKRAAGQLDADRHARARHAILSTFAHFGMGPAARSNGATLTGIVADFTAPLVVPPPGPAAPRGEASPALAIPDNAPAGVNSTIAIAGAGTVAAIKVGMNITHPFIGDLKVELVSPSGRRAVLHDRKGGGSDNIVSSFDSTTSAALSSLAGEPIAGNWVLEVRDLEGQDVGRLNQWSIELTPNV